ncbi:unnamed protein product, partial [Candidula unifasciata]
SWMQTCCLIIFGGGYDLGFEAALGREGTRQIQSFVCAGGSYLGLCAGAYWACDSILFDKGGPLEVTGERFLKFFPGMCIGPAFPGFQYETKAGVHAVPVRYTSGRHLDKDIRHLNTDIGHLETDIRHLETDIRHLDTDVKHLDAYSEGGGFFRLYNQSRDGCVLSEDRISTDGLTFSSMDTINTKYGVSCKDSCASHVGLTSRPPLVEILGTYSSLENNSPAIVRCRVGRGLAVLSGVHIEFPCHLLDHQNIYIKPWMPLFQRSEDTRLCVFKDILRQLGVQTAIS